MQYRFFKIVCIGVGLVLTGACSVKKAVAPERQVATKKQVAQFRKGDLAYEVYRQYLTETNGKKADRSKKESVRLMIRIVNKANNVSPLRAMSGSYDAYNSNNEYLLNGAKNDIMLLIKGQYIYPLYYSFENNYNSFPFETINLGYSISRQQKRSAVQLVFIDKVFTQDSIFFNLNFK